MCILSGVDMVIRSATYFLYCAFVQLTVVLNISTDNQHFD